jgi:quercetin dioxygenase-like cupin family protein
MTEFEFTRSRMRDPGAVITVRTIGLDLRVRLAPEASGGALTLIETDNAPGFGPPLHRHAETEIFRVLKGRYLYEVDGRRFVAEAGDVVRVPGGAAHAFVNIGAAPASQLVMILPGIDAAAFFTELGAVMADGAVDRVALASFGKKWGVDFIGPPLCVPPEVRQRQSRGAGNHSPSLPTGPATFTSAARRPPGAR